MVWSALPLFLCMLSFASAAPIDVQNNNHIWQYGASGGIVGFVVLILDIIVFSKFDSHFYRLMCFSWLCCDTRRGCHSERTPVEETLLTENSTQLVEVLQSNRPTQDKILWCLLVFLFPVVGVILYFLLSRRESYRRRGYEPIL